MAIFIRKPPSSKVHIWAQKDRYICGVSAAVSKMTPVEVAPAEVQDFNLCNTCFTEAIVNSILVLR